ncbi:MAG TPA: ethanolamine ammonia-lyase subunit EutC [Burkholderiaceae bacterium]|nr:ethanolamine ammonia-lyase subunit EutC [Burkholderiaceae bacterium]
MTRLARASPSPEPPEQAATRDPWQGLRQYTQARIALGRAGTSLPTTEVLRFAAAHAQARDAVQVPLDVEAMRRSLRTIGQEALIVHSSAVDRAEFLLRPDRGRMLAPPSAEALRAWRDAMAAEPEPAPRHAPAAAQTFDLVLVVADGLSAVAAQSHATAVVAALVERLAAEPAVRLGPIVIATLARVALADEIGALLDARLALILLGERPGLAAPDSLGAYLTYAPAPGRTDSERNCVSNIRPEGQAPDAAAARLTWLVRGALRGRATGIALKDASDALPQVPTATPPPLES